MKTRLARRAFCAVAATAVVVVALLVMNEANPSLHLQSTFERIHELYGRLLSKKQVDELRDAMLVSEEKTIDSR